LKTVATISKRRLRIGGEQHSGWLPEGAATPLPTPIRELDFELSIVNDGFGFLFCYNSEDNSVCGDTWHETLKDALAAAKDYFGISESEWIFSS
jgi:hypothetical protein